MLPIFVSKKYNFDSTTGRYQLKMENWKAIAFLLASGQGLILSTSLIVKGIRKQTFHLFLGLILFTLALELLNAWGMQVLYHERSDAFPFWNLQSYLILPPAMWFFVKLTTTSGFVFRKKYWIFFLPAILEVLIQFARRTYSQLSQNLLPSLLDNSAWFFITEILPIIGMAFVLWYYGRELLLFRRKLNDQSGHLTLNQYIGSYGFFIFFLTLTILWAAGVLLDLPVFSVIEIVLMLFIFTLGYIGYLNPNFFTLPILLKAGSPEKTDFIQYDDQKQLERLMLTFRRDGLYTQPKLSLEEVSEKLNLPVRYVSYVINTHSGSNFNNFVNGFRVEEVIRKLGDPAEQHKTILALALEAGFNSKSTFNQVFKQHTGKSPSDYLLVQK